MDKPFKVQQLVLTPESTGITEMPDLIELCRDAALTLATETDHSFTVVADDRELDDEATTLIIRRVDFAPFDPSSALAVIQSRSTSYTFSPEMNA